MKRSGIVIFMIISALMITLTGCGQSRQGNLKSINDKYQNIIGINSKVTVNVDNAKYTADLKTENGSISLELKEPKILSGFKIESDGKNYKLSYYGIETTKSDLPLGVKSALKTIFDVCNALKGGFLSVKSNGENLSVATKINDGTNLTLELDKDTLKPLIIRYDNNSKIFVEFSDFEFIVK